MSPEFDWDRTAMWKLPLPVQEMEIQALLWHLDLPFWEKEGTDDWNLAPRAVIRNPELEPSHFAKIQQADTAYPLDVIFLQGKYRILDGLHRLVKCYLRGDAKVRVRIIPPEQFDRIRIKKR